MRRLLVLLAAIVVLVSLASAQKPTGQTPKTEKARFAKYTRIQSQAKAAYLKSPGKAAVRKKYVDSTVDLGLEYMYSETVERKSRYRTALNYFREALKADPSNHKARENVDMLVSIYRSLGRPVPGG